MFRISSLFSTSSALFDRRFRGTGTHLRKKKAPTRGPRAGVMNVVAQWASYAATRSPTTGLPSVNPGQTNPANLFSDFWLRCLHVRMKAHRKPFQQKGEQNNAMYSWGSKHHLIEGSYSVLHQIDAARSHPQYARPLEGNASPNDYRFVSSRSVPPPLYVNPYDTGYDYSIPGSAPLSALIPHLEPADGSFTEIDDAAAQAAIDAMVAAGATSIQRAALADDRWWQSIKAPPAILHSIRYLVGEVFAQHTVRVKWQRLAMTGVPFSPVGGGMRVHACPPPLATIDAAETEHLAAQSRPLYQDGLRHPSSLVRGYAPSVIGNNWDSVQTDVFGYDAYAKNKTLLLEWPHLSGTYVS